ncbi:MAG: glycosyltransferase family 4 protein [Flavobacteriales bacterium]|nr:glycosyltransferase family 4 protein [Flavobacteriales bacterium]MCC6938882.1 glycosyltransferase family 4 protein [Flavobacteriales bacterium]
MSHRHLKILFIAFACEPERGSEPMVGWNCAWHASRNRPVWVITDPLHQVKMDRWLAENGEKNIRVIYHAMPSWVQWMWKSLITVNIYYYFWNLGANRVARKLHAQERFDVVHHVTYVRYWMPSAGAGLGIPFVWGPLGGGESAPRGFLKGMAWKGKMGEVLRDWMRWVFERDPRLKSCARSASISIACSAQTAERMQRLGVKDLRVMSSIGIDPKAMGKHTPRPEDGITRFISVGRLLHWKGFHFGLEAFAKAAILNAEFVVVGSGPCLEPLREQAKAMGIADKVRFTGELPWRDALKQFQDADVLVHPSLHDSGGFVLLEAMEMAKPVICLDLGGPGVYVNADCGFAVKAGTVDQAIADIASAMQRLAEDKALRQRLGEAGRERVLCEFTWERSAERYEAMYRELVPGPWS